MNKSNRGNIKNNSAKFLSGIFKIYKNSRILRHMEANVFKNCRNKYTNIIFVKIISKAIFQLLKFEQKHFKKTYVMIYVI